MNDQNYIYEQQALVNLLDDFLVLKHLTDIFKSPDTTKGNPVGEGTHPWLYPGDYLLGRNVDRCIYVPGPTL